ncbi:hypothetical protein PaG_03918 [Moesziomyces aphidis]|uniref:Uncharacterized protein n=1 Tax=Moesziomyces aphidis TaxID=84754 RepID=W3VM03_MOEAP|nr:hypothetical protein PaG_03918 [Moesziomyces aphidis]
MVVGRARLERRVTSAALAQDQEGAPGAVPALSAGKPFGVPAGPPFELGNCTLWETPLCLEAGGAVASLTVAEPDIRPTLPAFAGSSSLEFPVSSLGSVIACVAAHTLHAEPALQHKRHY